jgi:aldose 1-epimerase
MKSLEKKDFKKDLQGKQVDLYELTNGTLTATVTNYGARIVSILVPDKNNHITDVVVGPGTLQEFLICKEPYYGAAIGRYANRIANGRFTILNEPYTVPVNNGINHLHGGLKGFHNVVWDTKLVKENELELTYFTADGEDGYPGNLFVKLTYTITQENALAFSFEATTDKATICNFTNHAFFNLNGCGSGSIENHWLQVNADHYLPIDENQIPTGQIKSVVGSVFDFLKPVVIGSRISEEKLSAASESDVEQIKFGAGYDHCFVLNTPGLNHPQPAAIATGDKSGIELRIYTTEPGMQFYSGNFMKGLNTIKGGGYDHYRTAFALETQHYPDSPNQLHFPSTLLLPDEVYTTRTLYQFGVTQ